jgi:hypothetical protein
VGVVVVSRVSTRSAGKKVAEVGKLRHDVAMSDAAERSTVSLHEVKVFLALRGKPGQWLTNDEIGKESGVKIRTARQYTLRFVNRGLLERARLTQMFRRLPAVRAAAASQMSAVPPIPRPATNFALTVRVWSSVEPPPLPLLGQGSSQSTTS